MQHRTCTLLIDKVLASQWEREQAVRQQQGREREDVQRRAATEAHRAALRHDRWQHRSMTETSLHERTAPIAMSLGLCCLQGPKVQLKRTELIDDTMLGVSCSAAESQASIVPQPCHCVEFSE